MFLCGFTDALALENAYYGPGTGHILLDDLICNGTEPSLFDCNHDGIGVHDCDHSEDASVRCQGNIICIHIILLSFNTLLAFNQTAIWCIMISA